MDCLSEQDALDRVAMGNLGVNAPGLDRRGYDATAAGSWSRRSPPRVRRMTVDRASSLQGCMWVAMSSAVPSGKGGMAVVWEADDLHLGRKVALKWLHPALSANATARAVRILREARGRAPQPPKRRHSLPRHRRA